MEELRVEDIDIIFELLNEWRTLPGYQVEKRLELFFVLCLPEILKQELNLDITYENIFPEFPLKRGLNGTSECADYAILVEQKQKLKMYLIEIETDMKQISKSKIKTYKKAAGIGLERTLEAIRRVKKTDPEGEKYTALVKKITSLRKSKRTYDRIEVVYIIPKHDKEIEAKIEETTKKILTFQDMIDDIPQNSQIAMNLKELLERMKKEK